MRTSLHFYIFYLHSRLKNHMIYLQFCIFNLDSPLKMLYDLPESVVTASDVVLSKTVEKRFVVSAASVVSDWTVGVASEVVIISVVVSSVVLVVC